ncbi:GntR family transcriptional regulator [Streptomyces sp. NBC_00233]|uniref:GntR family transcriptional regulator n=1 Tax=Streptomyces sp. NBC_00233 TaxID=2975686 RepID=UPI0022512957|nr:GntR family transcriptional regulator [Streptomyces sp. NBC_00233]MCX5233052.1 GntR family transcriptional regulator [Streptomyces sp. NBC_00233]
MIPPTLLVDVSSPVPPYEQVRAQLADLILSGQLPLGERLPSVRQLAADLGLAAGTMARAYHELENAGLVHSRRGAGTHVTRPPGPTPAKNAQLLQAAQAYIATGRRLGADDDQLADALRSALKPAPPVPQSKNDDRDRSV